MTDETRILRTVGVPIVIAVILLFVLPKMCVSVVQVSKARKEAAERAAGGLHIESSQKPPKPIVYPAGLDADRVKYLVEIDHDFSTPYAAHVNKSLGASSTLVEQQQIISVLQKLGYAEVGGDGTVTLTRDGTLHLDGLVDGGSSWSFPIATREFNGVAAIESDGSNAHAKFAWKWKPNGVGAELVPSPQRHDAKAELANVGGRWSLTGIAELDKNLE